MKHKKSKKRSKLKRHERNSPSSNGDEEDNSKTQNKKRKRHSSTDSSEDEEKRKRKNKKRKNKDKRKKQDDICTKSSDECFDVPISLMASSSMAPMSKEEWEKKQSVTKRVYDESTGRFRLVKGDGEVIEEIVSRDRHKGINKQATKGDGSYFQMQTLNKS